MGECKKVSGGRGVRAILRVLRGSDLLDLVKCNRSSRAQQMRMLCLPPKDGESFHCLNRMMQPPVRLRMIFQILALRMPSYSSARSYSLQKCLLALKG